MGIDIDTGNFIQEMEKLPPNRFVAMLDIMGFKKIVEAETTSQVGILFKKIYERIKEREYSSHLHITHFSDTILIISNDDTVDSFEDIVNTAASFENMMIANGYAINGCISYGRVAFESNNSFGEPIANAHLQQEDLFFYGIILDEYAEKKYHEYLEKNVLFSNGFGSLSSPDMVIDMMIPSKNNGWINKYMINWMDVFSRETTSKVGLLTYDDQIPLLRTYMENLYKKYVKNGSIGNRANMYILHTELVLREWYNFTGEKNGRASWGTPLFDKYLIKTE